jgi:hypothetical protein
MTGRRCVEMQSEESSLLEATPWRSEQKKKTEEYFIVSA